MKRCRTLLPPPGSGSIRYRHDEDGRAGSPLSSRTTHANARGRSASVTTQVTSYSKPFGNRLCPVNLAPGCGRPGSPSQAARMHSGLHPPTRVMSATRSHTSSGRATTTSSAAVVSPVTSSAIWPPSVPGNSVMSSSRFANNPALAATSGSGRVVVADGGTAAGPRRRLGLVMVPRFGLAGVEPAHGDQAEPEVADFGQQPVQRGLVSEQPADDRLLSLAADLEAVEPGGPPAVQDTRHADFIPGRPAGGAHSSPSQRPDGGAIASASARGPGRAVPVMACCMSWRPWGWAVRHTAATRRRVGWLAIIKITS